MDKAQAIDRFWNSFGLDAYEQTTVDKDAQMPYITYEVVTDSFENAVSMSADLWYYSESWAKAEQMASRISKFIGISGVLINLGGKDGYMWIKRDTPFSQHVTDPNDMVRRIRIGIQVEFLTAL